MPPLTPAMFEIVAALAAGPLHGYAIAKRIVAMHQNTVRSMGPATLYGSIQKLMDLGLLEENGVLETDSRRKTYKLTQAGQSVFAEQFNQRQRFLDSARSSAPEGLASGGAR